MLYVMLFPMFNVLYFTSVLSAVCVQCPVWLFAVVPWCRALLLVLLLLLMMMMLQWSLLLLLLLNLIPYKCALFQIFGSDWADKAGSVWCGQTCSAVSNCNSIDQSAVLAKPNSSSDAYQCCIIHAVHSDTSLSLTNKCTRIINKVYL
jgi:hypothetical protein